MPVSISLVLLQCSTAWQLKRADSRAIRLQSLEVKFPEVSTDMR
jgi:hypothetical protein